MHTFVFSCPHCGAKLRMQGRRHLGKQINCPDCDRPLLIESDGHKAISVRAAGEFATKGGPAKNTRDLKTPTHVRKTEKHSTAGEMEPGESAFGRTVTALKSPVGIAWSVAALCTLAVAIAVLSGSPQRLAGRSDGPPDSVPSGENQPPAGREKGERPASADAVAPASNPETETIDARLARLGTMLRDYAQKHGHIPTGTVPVEGMAPSDRLSWLALLAAELDGHAGPQPVWQARWRDPLNDRFVRRRVHEFQNPLLTQLVTENRYPTTHVVGMAGAGADAASLPVQHPRAGIFGYDRTTRIEDVRDGTSNTIMVAGVQDKIGAWAAGGTATVRGFTQDPCVNGPDGFGTGQADGMYVLMADGSVRFVSRETASVVVRRMAAMADGLPLDPNVPGEPGDLPMVAKMPDAALPRDAAPHQGGTAEAPVTDPKQDAPVQPVPDNPASKPAPDAASTVLVEKVLSELDAERALSQKIARFDQATEVPLAKLVDLLEEMAAIPIEFDESVRTQMPDRMNQPIRLTLKDTTVGGILEAALKQAGLTHSIQKDGIRIRPDTAEKD